MPRRKANNRKATGRRPTESRERGSTIPVFTTNRRGDDSDSNKKNSTLSINWDDDDELGLALCQHIKSQPTALSTSSGEHSDNDSECNTSSVEDGSGTSDIKTRDLVQRALNKREETGTSSGEHATTEDHQPGLNGFFCRQCDEEPYIHTDPEDTFDQGDATNIIELFNAAREGRSKDAIGILETEPMLLQSLSGGPSALERDWLRAMIPQKEDTPLHYAARAGRLTTVKDMVWFIKGHSEPDGQVSLKLLEKTNKNGDTPLHVALKNKQVEVAAYLIKERPQVGYQVNKIGVSPLYLALDRGYMELVEDVFRRWPGEFVSDSVKESLLGATKAPLVNAAIRSKNLEILKKVMNNLPKLVYSTDQYGWQPLSVAAYEGDLDVVVHILDKYPDSIEKPDKDGLFPIHKAVGGGHISVVKHMLSLFPDSKFHVGEKGETVVTVASNEDKLRMYRYLLNLPDGKRLADMEMKRYKIA